MNAEDHDAVNEIVEAVSATLDEWKSSRLDNQTWDTHVVPAVLARLAMTLPFEGQRSLARALPAHD